MLQNSVIKNRWLQMIQLLITSSCIFPFAGYFRFSRGLYIVGEANGTVYITVERFGYIDVEASVGMLIDIQ